MHNFYQYISLWYRSLYQKHTVLNKNRVVTGDMPTTRSVWQQWTHWRRRGTHIVQHLRTTFFSIANNSTVVHCASCSHCNAHMWHAMVDSALKVLGIMKRQLGHKIHCEDQPQLIKACSNNTKFTTPELCPVTVSTCYLSLTKMTCST